MTDVPDRPVGDQSDWHDLIEALRTLCEESDYEIRFEGQYSGRGMFGKKCVGLVGLKPTAMRFIGGVIQDFHFKAYELAVQVDGPNRDSMSEKADLALLRAQEVTDLLMSMEWDTMGYDVIAYWKELAV